MADAEVAKLTVSFEETSLEEVLIRHRRERKELQAKIQELKKNAPKSDKKKRKEAMEEVSRLEHELEHRHGMEVKEARALEESATSINESVSTTEGNVSIQDNSVGDNNEVVKTETPQRISKAQKRRDKKAQEAREREEYRNAAAKEAELTPDLKALETNKLLEKLKEHKLTLYEVPSDGNCLYNSIRHQLEHNGLVSHSLEELRTETANFIRANKENFICYMTNPRTDEILNDKEFEEYCEAVRSTAAWGGQIELKALSSVLKVPIEVLQAEGPPTVQGSDEFSGPNLIITYHRHMYSLGEHYNSTKPISEDGDKVVDKELN